MPCPRAIIFDLDDTLAESFKPPLPEVIEGLKRLLEHIPVAIITGRDLSRIEPGFLPKMVESPRIDRFYVLPESSAECFIWQDGAWKEQYGLMLTDAERATIRAAIEESLAETNVLEGLPCFGQQLVEKRAQTAFAMLGLDVPTDIKYAWDPGNVKRRMLQQAIARRLSDFDVLFGGATSIDVTKRGVNKSIGIEWLSKQLGLPTEEMLYVGDAFGQDGNDAVVVPTGVRTHPVSGPAETETVIRETLEACAG